MYSTIFWKTKTYTYIYSKYVPIYSAISKDFSKTIHKQKAISYATKMLCQALKLCE